MYKLFKSVLLNFLTSRRASMTLGRWCHSGYSSKCNAEIKSHLANVDNSSNNTGLCLNRKTAKNINKKGKFREISEF